MSDRDSGGATVKLQSSRQCLQLWYNNKENLYGRCLERDLKIQRQSLTSHQTPGGRSQTLATEGYQTTVQVPHQRELCTSKYTRKNHSRHMHVA